MPGEQRTPLNAPIVLVNPVLWNSLRLTPMSLIMTGEKKKLFMGCKVHVTSTSVPLMAGVWMWVSGRFCLL